MSCCDRKPLPQRQFGLRTQHPARLLQEHDGKSYRLFFVRECDMLESHDGYCFCFGQPA